MATRKNVLSLLSGMFAFGACHAQSKSATPHGLTCQALTGRWFGELNAGSQTLRLLLDSDGQGGVVMVSLDQGGGRIPATGGRCTPEDVELDFASIGGKLRARKGGNGTLVGTWTQSAPLPISFRRLASDEPVPELKTGTVIEELHALVIGNGAPGAVAGWSRGDATIVAADGVRVAGELTKATRDDLWHIGSITKSFTATMIARLVERGVLGWDMTLSDGFGAAVPNMREQYRAATLSELLTGRSGLPTNLNPLDMISFAGGQDGSLADRLKWTQKALGLAPEGPRGEKFVYPNNGYVVAAALCEVKTGKAWETLIKEEVFVPLGLASAGFGAPQAGQPQGHRKAILGGRFVPVGFGMTADNPPAMGPAGRVHLSMGDLLKFGRAHAAGHSGKLQGYLSQAAWQRLHTAPAGGDYAYGWVVRDGGQIWHNGSNTSWLAELLVDLREDWAAAAVINHFGNVTKVMRAATAEASAAT